MHLRAFQAADAASVIDLFTAVFSDSEGSAEGTMIGALVQDLISTTAAEDLQGFLAVSGAEPVGAIFFSRLWFPDGGTGFILSPVAVATVMQGQGIGQQLINYGLKQLQQAGVDRVFTYGDPAYYGKAGFAPISETVVKAPLKLSFPHGWLAQSLQNHPIMPMQGAIRCVGALNDQKYW